MAIGASLTDAIGGTPLVRLNKVVPVGAADVFVKLEWFNPTGSYKDRMALAMVEEAERHGDLKPGMTVVEYTVAVRVHRWHLSAPSRATPSRSCRRTHSPRKS